MRDMHADAAEGGRTAAGDLGVGDFLGAHLGDAGESGFDSHLFGGAGHVDGHIFAHLAPLQLVLQEAVDEGHRLIQRKSAGVRMTKFRDARSKRSEPFVDACAGPSIKHGLQAVWNSSNCQTGSAQGASLYVHAAAAAVCERSARHNAQDEADVTARSEMVIARSSAPVCATGHGQTCNCCMSHLIITLFSPSLVPRRYNAQA